MVIDKSLIGAFTILIGIVSYSFYFRDMFRGKTKPDPFSWLIWSILAGITFFAQLSEGGGPGAWVTGFTSVICFLIAFIAYTRYDGHTKRVDEISLLGAFVAIVIWYLTDDPVWAVVLAVLIGAIGFIPTFLKAFSSPGEETVITYFLNAWKFFFAFLALDSFTLTTWLYPISLFVMNILLSTTLFLRQRKLISKSVLPRRA